MSTMFGARAPFYKLQGCGNDFVALDNRVLRLPEALMAEWAQKICPRAFGVGADGLFFLDYPAGGAAAETGADYCWHFFNADGSRAHPPKDERTTPHHPVSIAAPTRYRPFVPRESQLSKPWRRHHR